MAETKTFVDVNMNGQNINNLTAVYFGDRDTDGSWRITLSGTTLLIEIRVSGAWVSKGSFNP